MTHHITDEQIVAAAARNLGECVVENCGLGDIKDFARAVLALAAPQGAPIGYVTEVAEGKVLMLPRASLNTDGLLPLYTAPAPAVPMHRIGDVCSDEIADMRPERAYREGWNACRAAMLTAAPTPPAQPAAPSLQPACRYISEVLAGDAWPGEKHIARTIMHLLPLEQAMQATPAVPESADDAQIRAIGEGLLSAHDHIEMHKLERSHCKDADRIREGLAAFSAYQKRGDFGSTPAVPEDVARVNQQMLEALIALDTLYSPNATDSTARVWVYKARAAIDAARKAEKGGA